MSAVQFLGISVFFFSIAVIILCWRGVLLAREVARLSMQVSSCLVLKKRIDLLEHEVHERR
jgi:hypothetical protein